MLIRKYKCSDEKQINELGKVFNQDFVFSLDEFSDCLVLEENNSLVGFVIFSIMYERAEIIYIVIDSSFRLKGYAFMLLDKCINKIIENNCCNITLEVNCNNVAAINLYKKLGFKIAATRKKYYNLDDGYLMIKELR